MSIKLRDTEGHREIFDIVRQRYVALTPEEWVRQHFILYLHEELNYPLELIQVEGAITLNGMTRRCDIVVYDNEVKPFIIVECKKETVALTQKVWDQACRYNLVLQVPYLCLTNGAQQLCCKVDFAKQHLINIPELPQYHKKC
ncbi:MAG: type I restriction enzyme HsdR N-terminal domain-containing protein [Bacteroidales bacterium]|jgi:type I site-specific restriction endonuclease|nr:type I restriction enzyme HsdR N-terminal domain-containing protein [Bacteroidales bacterium]